VPYTGAGVTAGSTLLPPGQKERLRRPGFSELMGLWEELGGRGRGQGGVQGRNWQI
jgi:hypothetical protein